MIIRALLTAGSAHTDKHFPQLTIFVANRTITTDCNPCGISAVDQFILQQSSVDVRLHVGPSALCPGGLQFKGEKLVKDPQSSTQPQNSSEGRNSPHTN